MSLRNLAMPRRNQGPPFPQASAASRHAAGAKQEQAP